MCLVSPPQILKTVMTNITVVNKSPDHAKTTVDLLKLALMADKLIVLNPSRHNWGKNTSCPEANLEFFSFFGGGGLGLASVANKLLTGNNSKKISLCNFFERKLNCRYISKKIVPSCSQKHLPFKRKCDPELMSNTYWSCLQFSQHYNDKEESKRPR